MGKRRKLEKRIEAVADIAQAEYNRAWERLDHQAALLSTAVKGTAERIARLGALETEVKRLEESKVTKPKVWTAAERTAHRKAAAAKGVETRRRNRIALHAQLARDAGRKRRAA